MTSPALGGGKKTDYIISRGATNFEFGKIKVVSNIGKVKKMK